MYFGHFPVMLMRRRPRCQIRVKGKASTKSSTGDDQPRDDWPICSGARISTDKLDRREVGRAKRASKQCSRLQRNKGFMNMGCALPTSAARSPAGTLQSGRESLAQVNK